MTDKEQGPLKPRWACKYCRTVYDTFEEALTCEKKCQDDYYTCPTCGQGKVKIEDYPVPEAMKDIPYEPPRLEYHAIHEVHIEMPGDLGRVEATRMAIEHVREYMKTLPEGGKLRQACPQRHVETDGRGAWRSHWLVRCIIIRTSDKLDCGWEDLLDVDERHMINLGRDMGL